MSKNEIAAPVADTLSKRLFLSIDGLSAWIAIGIGLLAIAEGFRLGLGSLARMGPGYYPAAAGAALVFLGVVLLVNAARRNGIIAHIPFGIPVVLLLVSLMAFAVLLPMFGLAPATIVLMLIAALAVTGRIGVADILYAVATSVVATLVFINGLGMVLPAIRWPF